MNALLRYLNVLLCILSIGQLGCAQSHPKLTNLVEDPEFDQKINAMIRQSIPVIGVQELRNIQDEVIIFDARRKEEFDTSHIPGARYLGFKEFDPKRLEGIQKDEKIILYCSIGYRSEKIGDRLKALGYSNVYNLYGSIFEWANRGYPLVNEKGKQIKKVHTYNYSWSKWIHNEQIEKVW